MKQSKIIFIVLGLLLLAVLSTSLSFYIYNSTKTETDKEVEILVVIDFGTLTSADDYIVQYVNVTEGKSAYYAFSLVVELTVRYDPLIGGVFVEGVNGYMQSGDDYWYFYYYDIEQEKWSPAPVGVSHYYLYEGDRIKLAYSG